MLLCFIMAALVSGPRELFSEAVRSVLETWPVLQIAVDNGFGGLYSQQKADWMADAVQQYFHDNSDLEQDEVEDFLSELMNNEFDTVVDDGSLPQVAQEVCEMFRQCKQGNLAEVKQQISRLREKKAAGGRAKVTPVKSPTEENNGDDDDEEEEEEAMECDEAGSSADVKHHQPSGAAQKEEKKDGEEGDGWTVVRRKK